MHHSVKLLIVFTALFGVSSGTQSFINKTDSLGSASVLSTTYDNGPEVKLYNGRSYNHGDTLAVAWSKLDAGGGCDSLNGWVETGWSNQGYYERTIDACGTANHGVNIECYTGRGQRMGNTVEEFTINTNTCPSGNSGPVCGNGICQSGETSSSCPSDCGTGGGGGGGGGGEDDGGGGGDGGLPAIPPAGSAIPSAFLSGEVFKDQGTTVTVSGRVKNNNSSSSTYWLRFYDSLGREKTRQSLQIAGNTEVSTPDFTFDVPNSPGSSFQIFFQVENPANTALSGAGPYTVYINDPFIPGSTPTPIPTPIPGPNDPRITSFTADRPILPAGQTTTLRWAATNATSCNALSGPGFVTGGKKSGFDLVGPIRQLTSFILECVNGSSRVSLELYIDIGTATPTPIATPTPSPLGCNPNPPLTCEDGNCDDDAHFNRVAPYFGDDCDDANACTLGPQPGFDCFGNPVSGTPTPIPPVVSPPLPGTFATLTATPLDAKADQEITLTWNSTAPPASYCDGYYPQGGFQFNTDRKLFGSTKGAIGGPGQYRYEVVCYDATGKRVGSAVVLIIISSGTTSTINSEAENLKNQIRSRFGVVVEGNYSVGQLGHMINVMGIAGIGNLSAIKDSLDACPDAGACMSGSDMYIPRSLGNWFGLYFVHELYHAIDDATGNGYAQRVGQSLANGNYDIRQNLLQGRSQYSGTNHTEFWAELGAFYWYDRDGLSQRAQSQKNAGYAEPMAQYNIIAEQRGHTQLSQTGSKNIFAAIGDILSKSSNILIENVSAQSLRPETASTSGQIDQDLVQDTVGPSVRILSPTNKATLVTSNILITGKALSNPKENTPVAGVQIVHNGSSTVIIPRASNCGSQIVLNCYTWQKLITLASGENIISVVAIDTAGKLSSTPLQISLTYNPGLKVVPTVQVQCSIDNGITFQESCTAGTEVLLRWEVLNLTKCTTTETGKKSSWSNVGKNLKVSGMSVVIGDATNLSKTYTMSCTGPGGTTKDTLKVTYSKIKTAAQNSAKAQIPTDLESLLYSSLVALIGTALYTMYTRTMKHKIRIQ